ncbi:MAG: N-6 DNA methylase [Sulfolobales archaeon]
MRECSKRVERIYGVISRYLDLIIEAMGGGFQEVETYIVLLHQLYPRSSREELLRIASAHTALQILVNIVVGMHVAGDKDIDAMCYGYGLERYGVLVDPLLLWWRSGGVGDDLFTRICKDLAQEVMMASAADIAFGNIFDKLYSRLVGRDNRYYMGEYYTPPWVARIAIERASIYSGGLAGRIIADPACGSGVFLAHALRAKMLTGEDPIKAFQSIWGLDINPMAVIISRARMLVAFKALTGLDPREPPRIFRGDFIDALTMHSTDLNRYNDRSNLLSNEDQKIKEDLGRDSIKADVVVTNPPWLELNELPKTPWGMRVRRYVRNSIIRTCSEKIPGLSKASWKGDLSAVFLDLSLRLVGKGGVVGILLPANQSYSGSPSPHGAGKLLTLAIIMRWRASGEILYLGDIFGHGIHASLAILKRGLDLPRC